MRCVVTGGAGFIGSNLSLALQEEGHEVVVVDNLDSGSRDNLSGFRGEIIEDDIRTADWEQYNPDIIFHLGAITGVLDKDGNRIDDDLIHQVNFDASKRILEFCVKKNIPLIYASSSSVYGKAKPPFREEDAHEPESAYGKAKWAFDQLVIDTVTKKKNENLIVGLRYTNVFGPRERYKGKLASMVWQIAQQMLSDKKPKLFKYGEQDRDQIYVKDAVHGTLLAMNAKESCIVNIGSGVPIRFNEIVNVLNKVLGKNLEPEYIDNPWEHYQEHTQTDITKTKSLINYEPRWSFEDAVQDYMKEEGIVS